MEANKNPGMDGCRTDVGGLRANSRSTESSKSLISVLNRSSEPGGVSPSLLNCPSSLKQEEEEEEGKKDGRLLCCFVWF